MQDRQPLPGDESNPSFSELFPDASYNIASRKKKALTIHAILNDYLSGGLGHLAVLDIGASTGTIAYFLSKSAGLTIGIDVDRPAVYYAHRHFNQSKLAYSVGSALHLPFANNCFDVVVCAHIYEHVSDAHTLMSEIHRVLKNNGICYFAAGNRISIIEPHYNLPFLSIFPKPIADIYLKISGKADEYLERHLTYWGLKKLTRRFECTDYTQAAIERPRCFHTGYMIQKDTLKYRIARLVIRKFPFLSPGYIWILRKNRCRLRKRK